ncbi:MAG: tail-specific protease [Epsilonproteobacteria bacterium]|nr:MAG: tail-specific protease [Campylobacterota bacterium]RLA67778.1 MAG: tail-specific protease [Campylobacterota bacterium]
MTKFAVLIISLIITIQGFGYSDQKKAQLIGNIIKNALENYHYRGLKIDDDVSKKAFGEFIKRMDYSKTFLLKKDIAKLKRYEKDLDDQLISGKHSFLKEAKKAIVKRIENIESYREKIFKKNFNFSKTESIELDQEKRTFFTTEKELKDYWRKLFKHDVLIRYMAMVEEKSENKKDKDKKKKKKKKKKEKKLTDKEMRAKAKDGVSEKYEKFFKRLLERKNNVYLEEFLNAFSLVYDPHTNYLAPQKKEDFDIDISGSLEGIGAVLQEDGAYIKVIEIVPGGAAWRQKGLEVDDLIMMVAQEDGVKKDLVGMRVGEAVRYIRGKKGTRVKLFVKKIDGSRKTIEITRDVVHIAASFVKSSVLQDKNLKLKIGYILVPKFYRDFNANKRNCTEDVRIEINRLKRKKVDGIILDLRNNGGGALEDAKLMSGLFIKDGPIVQIRNHKGGVDVLEDNEPSIMYKGPLIVMMNRFSASASEILAGALQDYKRALIVGGENSHGKGTVQAVLNLNQGPLLSIFGKDMGALKVTIQKFYRVTGISTQYKGVTPDIILPDPFGYTKTREQDLDNSLPWDRIGARPYTPWTKANYSIDILKKRSDARVKNNPQYKKLVDSIKYLEKKMDDTNFSLNISKARQEEKENKKKIKSFKIEKENKNILISNFEASLKQAIKLRPGDEENWKTEFDEKKKNWVKRIRTDLNLQESMNIIYDMINVQKGKKISANLQGN